MLSRIPAGTVWRMCRSQHGPAQTNVERPVSEQSLEVGDRLLPPKPPRKDQLYELNESLNVLTSIFPDVQVEVFREMLSSFSEESRLQVVTENLLRHKPKWVRGRWKVPQSGDDGNSTEHGGDETNTIVPGADLFRSPEYKAAVKAAFYQEFKSLSHSAIKAVLAEHNYSYTHARPTLLELASKSWRVSLTNWVFRRKNTSASLNPLVNWQDGGLGLPKPVLVLTSSEELNAELEDLIICPLRQEQTEEQVKHDKIFARDVNVEEAEGAGAFFDCECCFIPQTFENISVCSAKQHYICFDCIRHTVKEALYGQGWAVSADVGSCSLRCIAASGSDGPCSGRILPELLQAALTRADGEADLWKRFEERMIQDSLLRSQMSLAKCPFCPYAEFKEQLPPAKQDHSPNLTTTAALVGIMVALSIYILEYLGVGSFSLRLLFTIVTIHLARNWRKLAPYVSADLQPADIARSDPNNGQKFVCQSPSCRRASCLRCLAPWHDIHVCHASQRQALRTYIESAVTNAIKRTCPRCQLSFVKSSGCNKLVCVCGYAMCYICRAEIGPKEGYGHFCPHFRPDPGASCTECDRCDLYKTEDEDVVISRAKENAVKEWREKEGMGSGKGVLLNLENDVGLGLGLAQQDELGQRPASRKGRAWF